MPKRLGSSDVIGVLREHGFFFASQKGSHAKYKERSRSYRDCATSEESRLGC